MRKVKRRDFIAGVSAGLATGWSLAADKSQAVADEGRGGGLHISPFRFDVTSPLGHSCCGRWIKPVVAVDDPLEKQISNKSNRVVGRNRPSYMLSWLRRLEQRTPIVLSSLHAGDVRLLHLPAECFVQYQLRAQETAASCFVATAAYGDGGPWYIPVKEEYPCGGCEVSGAFCDPEIDGLLTAGMKRLL